MPSMLISLTSGDGFVPILSGNPWSGHPLSPTGGIQLRAANVNSGAIYISLSGAFIFSGVVGLLPASGGPTINSGTFGRSGVGTSGFGGNMDGMALFPGDSYFVPKVAIQNNGPASGVYQLCVSCDAACSGQARLYYEGL